MNSDFFRNLHKHHHGENHALRRMVIVLFQSAALISLQPLVDSSHVVDLASIIVAQNSLTKFLRGVDSQSFFDISDVFPIGGKSGIRVTGHRRTT
jgi:hypothetical protein